MMRPVVPTARNGKRPSIFTSLGCGIGAGWTTVRSRDVRRTGRRPRARYSGPCLRGSAYSRGFTVQYVPESAPTHAAPSQTGSSSAAPSYVVDPGCARGVCCIPGLGRGDGGVRRGACVGRAGTASRLDGARRPAATASASATSYASVIRAKREVAASPLPIASGCVDFASRRKATLIARADGFAESASTRHASSTRIFGAGIP